MENMDNHHFLPVKIIKCQEGRSQSHFWNAWFMLVHRVVEKPMVFTSYHLYPDKQVLRILCMDMKKNIEQISMQVHAYTVCTIISIEVHSMCFFVAVDLLNPGAFL